MTVTTSSPYETSPDWPPLFNTGFVYGRFVNADATPCVGSIVFTPTPAAMLAVNNLTTVMPAPITVSLDSSGAIAVELPLTDDPDIRPERWTYAVTENFAGGRHYNIEVPMPVAGDIVTLPDRSLVTLTGRVDTAASLPGSGVAKDDAFLTMDTAHVHVVDALAPVHYVDAGAPGWNIIDMAPAPSSIGIMKYLGPQGTPGARGETGAKGAKGDTGASGLGTWASGILLVSVSNSAGSGTIEFPVGRFSGPPHVTATVASPDGWLATVASVNANISAVINIRRTDGGTTASGTMLVNWLAVDAADPPSFAFPVLATNVQPRPQMRSGSGWAAYGNTPNTALTFDEDTAIAPARPFAKVTVNGITANSGVQHAGGITPDPAKQYQRSVFARNPGPASMRFRFGGTGGWLPAGAWIDVPGDDAWHRYNTLLSPNNATTGNIRMEIAYATSPTGVLDFAGCNVTEGPTLFDYIDGDQPGCQWVGAVNNSASELIAARTGDISAITGAEVADLRAVELRGAGMPEGVISAPVGTSYTDTAATNGAIRYVKSSGTAATGWRCVYGDTGWRNINSEVINGWGQGVWLRRRNDQVMVHFNNLTASAATDDQVINNLGTGWGQLSNPSSAGSPLARIPIGIGIGGATTPPAGGVAMVAIGFGTPSGLSAFRIERATLPAGVQVTGRFSYQTDHAWPATLPGA